MANTSTTDQILNPLIKWDPEAFYIGRDTRTNDGDDATYNNTIYTRLVTGISATTPDTDAVNWLSYSNPGAAAAALIPQIDSATSVNGATVNLGALTLADDTVYHIEVIVVGRRTDSADDASFGHIVTAFREAGGPAVIQGLVNDSHTRRSSPSWVSSVIESGNDIQVTGKGTTGHTVNFKSYIVLKTVT